MYWKILSLVVFVFCIGTLHLTNKIEQKVVYNHCLKEYNYQDLEQRYNNVTHEAGKQRIVLRAVQLKSKCNKRAKEHFSI